MEETEIELSSVNSDEKLVVYGAITPGEDVCVYVAKTYSDESDTLSVSATYLFNANVYLYNGNWDDSIKLELKNDSESNYYCTAEDANIKKGETYELYVSVDGYTSVSAETTVPEEAANWEDDWKITTVKTLFDGDYYDDFVFTGSWKIPSTNNYQFITSYCSGVRGDFDFNYNEKDGYAIYESDVFTNFINDDFVLVLTLVTADSALYNYVEYYTFYNEVLDDVHDYSYGLCLDLFRGIMPEYTNIQNGYGVFGSYLQDTLTIYEASL